MIGPVTEKLANEYQGRLKFCKLNVDENRQTATKYQVMSIPTLLFFKGGKAVEQNIGAVSEPMLHSKVGSLLGQQQAPRIRQPFSIPVTAIII
jgi:thioredoxin 1